jgi:hypothetical protein
MEYKDPHWLVHGDRDPRTGRNLLEAFTVLIEGQIQPSRSASGTASDETEDHE